VNDDAISNDQYNALSHADLWLSSSARQAMTQLEKPTPVCDAGSTSTVDVMRFYSAQMQFLSAFFRTSHEEVRLSAGKDSEGSSSSCTSLSRTWIQSCQKVLAGFLNGGLVEDALDIVSPNAFVASFNDIPVRQGGCVTEKEYLTKEASACGFLCSFLSLQHCLLMDVVQADTSIESSEIKQTYLDTVSRVATLVADILIRTHDLSGSKGAKLPPAPRRGWLNRACFAIVELFNAAKEFNLFPAGESISHSDLVRKLNFLLLGRLERGDEAMALIIFSQEFQVKSLQTLTPQQEQTNSSVLSSMFFREMLRTKESRVQLDHSFKLKHGPGITPDKIGCFKLSTLLSHAESTAVQPGSQDFVLPVGLLWLWQVLSSSIAPQSTENVALDASGREKEAVEILSSCLSLIFELEEQEILNKEKCFGYTSRIPAGGKVYHLFNICLHPESILCNSLVTGPAELLLDEYNKKVDQSFGLEFASACVKHAANTTKKAKENSSEGEEDDSKTEKLAKALLKHPDNAGWGSLDENDVRALIDFSGELCEAYIEYGAQVRRNLIKLGIDRGLLCWYSLFFLFPHCSSMTFLLDASVYFSFLPFHLKYEATP